MAGFPGTPVRAASDLKAHSFVRFADDTGERVIQAGEHDAAIGVTDRDYRADSERKGPVVRVLTGRDGFVPVLASPTQPPNVARLKSGDSIRCGADGYAVVAVPGDPHILGSVHEGGELGGRITIRFTVQ